MAVDSVAEDAVHAAEAENAVNSSPAAPAQPVVELASYAKDDLVWGKVFGFPWWPCRVTGNALRESGKYPVRFFHTAERLALAPNQLLPRDKRMDLADPEKVKKPALKLKFIAALAEAVDAPLKGVEDDPPEPPRPAEQEEGWLTQGHFYIGQRVARRFELGGGKPPRVVVGTIRKWLPASVEATTGEEEPALFHVNHDDQDEEDLEEYEVAEAMAVYESTAEALKIAAKKAREEAREAKDAAKMAKAEEKALKAACAKYTAETPGRWGKVAAEVGGGKTGDACKKKSKEVK